uniref:histidine phosphatase family protein n=1 Tax=Salmonella enterica TaxID=28901 RepID=UPI0032972374
ARVQPLLESLTRVTLVVSHGGVARAVLTLLSRVTPDEAPHIDIWQGRILVFEGGAHRWEPS